MRILQALLAGCLVLVASQAADAQSGPSFPARTVTIVSPFAPGSAPDVSARLVGQLLSETWNKPVIVENRVGANGNLAMEDVARSTADGYTLVMAPDTAICVNPRVYSNLKFDAKRDFVPIASVVSNQFLLLTNPNVPANTLQEFIQYGRNSSLPLLYASIGAGSLQHLAMEMLKKRAGIDLTHVPYRGGIAALNAAIAGDIQATFAGASSAGFVQSGKLRALAVSGRKRSQGFPDLPTIGETYPGYAVDAWIGLFAPAKTPDRIVERIRGDLQRVLAGDAFQRRINVSGSLEPLVMEIQDFQKMIESDCDKYGTLVSEIGLRLD